MSESISFDDRIFTINEACAHLRISRGTAYKLIREKRLEIAKLANRTVVTGRALRACVGDVAPYDANKAV